MIVKQIELKDVEVIQKGAIVRAVMRSHGGVELRRFSADGEDQGVAFIPAWLVRCSLLAEQGLCNLAVVDEPLMVGIIGWFKGRYYLMDCTGARHWSPMPCVDVAPEFVGIVTAWMEEAKRERD